MVQKARPVADVSNDGWTPTPVCDRVNEETPNDGTFVTAPNAPVSSFMVRLAVLGPPATGPGRPVPALTVRLKGPGVVLVELLQNTALIASRTYDTTGAFEAYTMTLTDAEAVAVLWPQDGTDPDLRVRVTAYASSSSSGSSGSAPPLVPCGDGTVAAPPTFYLKFRDGSGGFGALDGVTVAMTWNGVDKWVGARAGFSTFSMVWNPGASLFYVTFAGCINATIGTSIACCAVRFVLQPVNGAIASGTCEPEPASFSFDVGSSDSNFECVACSEYPATMYATFSENCTDIGDMTLPRVGLYSWDATKDGPGCEDYHLTITCVNGALTWDSGGDLASGDVTVLSVSPFLATFSYTPLGPCCSSELITVTLKDTPT